MPLQSPPARSLPWTTRSKTLYPASLVTPPAPPPYGTSAACPPHLLQQRFPCILVRPGTQHPLIQGIVPGLGEGAPRLMGSLEAAIAAHAQRGEGRLGFGGTGEDKGVGGRRSSGGFARCRGCSHAYRRYLRSRNLRRVWLLASRSSSIAPWSLSCAR